MQDVADEELFLYIHIPFCLSKCPYCSFFSITEENQDLHSRYIDAVIREISVRTDDIQKKSGHQQKRLSTLFLGGGTPSLLNAHEFLKLFNGLRKQFRIPSLCEISVEVNPATHQLEKLRLFKELGVTRISVGVQSLHDDELQAIGRQYSSQCAIDCLKLCRELGFSSVSADVMAGLPGQTASRLGQTLEQIFSYVDHISLYQLTIEEKTVFWNQQQAGHLDLPDQQMADQIDRIASHLLADNGFQRYEISNYCRQGHFCRHNLHYWQMGDYLGIGAGAVSSINNIRSFNCEDVDQYMNKIMAGKSAVLATEKLDREARFREAVVIGLRLVEGIDSAALQKLHGYDLFNYYGATLQRLIDQNCIERENTRVRLTPRGMDIANSVMAYLV